MKIELEWSGIENATEIIDNILYHVSSNDLDCSIEVVGNCGKLTAQKKEVPQNTVKNYLVLASSYHQAHLFVPQLRREENYHYVNSISGLKGYEMGKHTVVIHCPFWDERTYREELMQEIWRRGYERAWVHEGEQWQDK